MSQPLKIVTFVGKARFELATLAAKLRCSANCATLHCNKKLVPLTGLKPARYYYFALEPKSRVSINSTTRAFVALMGLEPIHSFEYYILSVARLPITT